MKAEYFDCSTRSASDSNDFSRPCWMLYWRAWVTTAPFDVAEVWARVATARVCRRERKEAEGV
jgi:hypothetical protein